MMEAKLVQLTIQGSTLQKTGDTTSKTRKKRTASCKCSGESVSRQPRAGTLSRSVHRSKVALAQKVGRIKNKPSYHVSLNLPKGAVGQDFEVIVLDGCLDLFAKRLLKRYPGGYIIRTYGWSAEGCLHAHLLVRFAAKSSRASKEQEVSAIWGDIVNSAYPKLAKLSPYHGGRGLSYLTSPEKTYELRVIAHRLQGRRMWSIANAKNIRWHKKYSLELTEGEYHIFLSILKKLLAKAEDMPTSTWDQLEKKDFCLNYLPVKLLARAIKKFKKWRAAR